MALPIALSEQTETLDRLRLIIVCNSREYMTLLRRTLAETLPNIEVTEYDCEQKGCPDPDYDWSAYDAVLLDYAVGDGATGLDWLQLFKQCPEFPPAVLMATEGNEYLGARAIKLGAADYIRKADITSQRLGQMIVDAIGSGAPHSDPDRTLREERDSPHLEILESLARRVERNGANRMPGEGYRFVRLIGQGASSRVYLAERLSDDTTLVLKVIDAETVQDIQVVERFIREAEIVSTLSTPYVVKFYDYGISQTYGYIAMEFFTRGDLKQRIERHVELSDAVNYLRHISLGLEAIHAAGIVHRDLKPGNIMFRADDSLAIADFGISRAANSTSELTNHGCVLGTPNYLSPEQAMGDRADHRADLYSAGIVFFELLAGHKPYRAESAAALVYQHVHAEIPKLPQSLHHFQALIERLLAKDPAARIQSASELVQAVDQL